MYCKEGLTLDMLCYRPKTAECTIIFPLGEKWIKMPNSKEEIFLNIIGNQMGMLVVNVKIGDYIVVGQMQIKMNPGVDESRFFPFVDKDGRKAKDENYILLLMDQIAKFLKEKGFYSDCKDIFRSRCQ